MSLTPQAPNFKDGLKSFWQKPEGKVGLGVLMAAGIASVYGFTIILPWLILVVSNTIELVGLLVALGAMICVLWSKKFRNLIGNAFQLVMRWSVGQLIELDPIGMEKNYLDDMRQEKVKLDKGVAGCAGAKEGLEKNVSRNADAIEHDKSLIAEVDRVAARETNPVKKNGYMLQRQRYLLDIGRKNTTNTNLQKTLDMTNNLYSMLQRMQQLSEYNIDNLAAQIENDEQERDAIMQAYEALSPAQKLIRGEPEALAIFNQSRETAARQNAQMLGAMKDFSAYSAKYVTGMDIEQGAAAADAEKSLADIERTLRIAEGVQPQTVPQPQLPLMEAVPVRRGNDYFEIK